MRRFTEGYDKMTTLKTLAAGAALIAMPSLGLAQEVDTTPTNADIGFILTTFMFLVMGVLVFWMAAGFAMLEAGLVRSKVWSRSVSRAQSPT
jgi:Amt family ammonium transporter